jgi:hypothetical protein
MKDFDLNYQWGLYLERAGVTEQQLGFVQASEMKRAFFGGCGQMIILMRDEVAAQEDDKAIATMQDMLDQVGNFWLSETHKQN